MGLEDFIPVANGVSKLAEHPLIAWLLAMCILMIDAGIIIPVINFTNPAVWVLNATGFGAVTQAGLVGGLISIIINALFGFHGKLFVVTSFQLLVIVAITPVVLFALAKSVQLNKR
jgi:hypothetical protein